MSQSYISEFKILIDVLKQKFALHEEEKNKTENYEKNIFRFLYKDIFISILNQSGNIIFVSRFASLDNFTQKQKIKEYLLEANVLYLGSKGGSYAVNIDNQIHFAYQYPIEIISPDLFLIIIEEFLLHIDDTIEKLNEIENANLDTENNEDIPLSRELNNQTLSTQEGNWLKI